MSLSLADPLSEPPRPKGDGTSRYNPFVSHVEHHASSPKTTRCFVLTISDTRTEATDGGGRAIVDLLVESEHQVLGKAIVPDDADQVRHAVEKQLANPEVQAVIVTGGTGISARDGTFEVLTGLLEKRIDGFGELFRSLSYQEIGPAAMLSRACAGLAHGTIVISVPGSENAVRLAMTKLVLPELGHMVREASR